jgi:hypothetical protein
MKKMKMKIFGGAALALLGAGAIAAIPVLMTSCSKKTDLSKIDFNGKLNLTVGFEANKFDLAYNAIHASFIHQNLSKISEADFAYIDFYFTGSTQKKDGVSLILDASGSKKYKGEKVVPLEVAAYTATVGNSQLTEYDKNPGISIKAENILIAAKAGDYSIPAPVPANMATTTAVTYDYFGTMPNVSYFDDTINTTGAVNHGVAVDAADGGLILQE